MFNVILVISSDILCPLICDVNITKQDYMAKELFGTKEREVRKIIILNIFAFSPDGPCHFNDVIILGEHNVGREGIKMSDRKHRESLKRSDGEGLRPLQREDKQASHPTAA